MIEVRFFAVVFTIIVQGTVNSISGFSFCPALCSCENKRIFCQMDSLPVKLPPEPFTILQIKSFRNRLVSNVSVPPRAFQLSQENKNLSIRFFDVNIHKISAYAFEGVGLIDSIVLSMCRIDELQTNSFSNINVSTHIFITNSSIRTVHPFAFHEMNTTKFYIYRTNITRISTAAFSRVNAAKFYLFKSNVEFIEANAFGLWTSGINAFILKYTNIGSFECNEPNNNTSVSIASLSVNCTCDLIWMLRNTSSFYPIRSKFECNQKPGSSLLEMEDSLKLSCMNQTETIDESCSSRKLFTNKFINHGRIKSKSAKHLISVSLLLINYFIIYICNEIASECSE